MDGSSTRPIPRLSAVTDGNADQASTLQLDPELLNQLRVEFGDHGVRAIGFLETAQCLLNDDTAPLPRMGEVVAYCLREALTKIPKASAPIDRSPFGRVVARCCDPNLAGVLCFAWSGGVWGWGVSTTSPVWGPVCRGGVGG